MQWWVGRGIFWRLRFITGRTVVTLFLYVMPVITLDSCTQCTHTPCYYQGRRLCGFGGSWPPKMSHSFIQNCCLITPSFTSWRMKDLCQKRKVNVSFRGAWNSLMALTDWPRPLSLRQIYATGNYVAIRTSFKVVSQVLVRVLVPVSTVLILTRVLMGPVLGNITEANKNTQSCWRCNLVLSGLPSLTIVDRT